jgi:hypothetical protein
LRWNLRYHHPLWIHPPLQPWIILPLCRLHSLFKMHSKEYAGDLYLTMPLQSNCIACSLHGLYTPPFLIHSPYKW